MYHLGKTDTVPHRDFERQIMFQEQFTSHTSPYSPMSNHFETLKFSSSHISISFICHQIRVLLPWLPLPSSQLLSPIRTTCIFLKTIIYIILLLSRGTELSMSLALYKSSLSGSLILWKAMSTILIFLLSLDCLLANYDEGWGMRGEDNMDDHEVRRIVILRKDGHKSIGYTELNRKYS